MMNRGSLKRKSAKWTPKARTLQIQRPKRGLQARPVPTRRAKPPKAAMRAATKKPGKLWTSPLQPCRCYLLRPRLQDSHISHSPQVSQNESSPPSRITLATQSLNPQTFALPLLTFYKGLLQQRTSLPPQTVRSLLHIRHLMRMQAHL